MITIIKETNEIYNKKHSDCIECTTIVKLWNMTIFKKRETKPIEKQVAGVPLEIFKDAEGNRYINGVLQPRKSKP